MYNNDIININEYIHKLVKSLQDRRKHIDDLVQSLIMPYKGCPDEEFQAYITKKEEAYKDDKQLTRESLMHFAQQ